MTTPRTSRLLQIFCRLPLAGQVKTRLASVVGAERAAELYAACLRDAFETLRDCAAGVQLAYTPDSLDARDWFRSWVGAEVTLWPQPSGDLGTRLLAGVRSPAALEADAVVVIGSDSPGLPAEYVNSAFEELRRVDIVLGPAMDGGYYLLGLSNREGVATSSEAAVNWPACLFDGIDWSSSRVLEQTISRVRSAGRSLALLPPWYDVDTFDDVRRLRSHLRRLRESGLRSPCPRTDAVLADWPQEFRHDFTATVSTG